MSDIAKWALAYVSVLLVVYAVVFYASLEANIRASHKWFEHLRETGRSFTVTVGGGENNMGQAKLLDYDPDAKYQLLLDLQQFLTDVGPFIQPRFGHTVSDSQPVQALSARCDDLLRRVKEENA